VSLSVASTMLVSLWCSVPLSLALVVLMHRTARQNSPEGDRCG
jgi:type IV secretory pathway VirB3-like protein